MSSELRALLLDCKEKIQLFCAANKNQYVGGKEATQNLYPRIDAAIAALNVRDSGDRVFLNVLNDSRRVWDYVETVTFHDVHATLKAVKELAAIIAEKGNDSAKKVTHDEPK